jgi:hypothetical protein
MEGSNMGFEPDVKTRPVTAQQKKRKKMKNPKAASRFWASMRLNSCIRVRFGAGGASI